MTLALLLTAVTGAWAQSYEAKVFDVPASWEEDNTHISAADLPKDFVQITKDEAKALAVPDGDVVLVYGFVGENVLMMAFDNGTAIPNDDDDGAPEARGNFIMFQTMAKVCYTTPAGPKVAWNASTKTGTFAMPGSDVVLTPIYSAATIYSGQTETPFETLKEAFANVKDGDVIKLDWNVTLTETLKIPSTASDISFTLDFNGFVIDNTGVTNYIVIDNGCKLTLTDNSTAQTGGLKSQYPIEGSNGGKFIFQGGRYNFSGCSSQVIALEWDGLVSNYGWVMGDGKEFVDLNNGQPDDDGFMVRVDYKTYELTIGAGRFATFFDSNRIKLADGTDTNIGLYTISSIDADRSTATVTPISGIIPAGTPMLVYNGTEQKQTAKLIVTLDNAQDAVAWATQFKGTAKDHEFTADDMAAADYYALSGGKAFAPVRGAGILGANQCWLQFEKQEIPSARQFTLVFDSEATGIKTTDCTDYTDSVWYDLNGRKVAAPSKKGLYIMNGKKVVVK
jgi:hypothetical protein